MTKEQQDKYKELSGHLDRVRLPEEDRLMIIQLDRLRPEFTKKVRQVFDEEVKYLELEIEKL